MSYKSRQSVSESRQHEDNIHAVSCVVYTTSHQCSPCFRSCRGPSARRVCNAHNALSRVRYTREKPRRKCSVAFVCHKHVPALRDLSAPKPCGPSSPRTLISFRILVLKTTSRAQRRIAPSMESPEPRRCSHARTLLRRSSANRNKSSLKGSLQ